MKNTGKRCFHGQQQNNFTHNFRYVFCAQKHLSSVTASLRHPVYGRGNEVRSLFIARPVYSAFNLHRDKYRLAETTDLCPLADRKGERGTGTGGCRGWWRWKRRIERDTKAWRDQHFSWPTKEKGFNDRLVNCANKLHVKFQPLPHSTTHCRTHWD